MYVARQAGYSFPQIAEYFGGRDHSTVMHACEKVAAQAGTTPEVLLLLRELQPTIARAST
jgi:chromosomal replication initiator protein